MTADAVTTPGGLLLPLAVLVPFLGMIAGLVLGGRNAQRVAMVTIVAGVAIALGIAQSMLQSGDTLVYVLGGFAPPLGIARTTCSSVAPSPTANTSSATVS